MADLIEKEEDSDNIILEEGGGSILLEEDTGTGTSVAESISIGFAGISIGDEIRI